MKNPNACLPGADLVGFIEQNGTIHLVLGEVKTSSDQKNPPAVMRGPKGLVRQLHGLGSDLSMICDLLYWLLVRCKDKDDARFEELFDSAVSSLLDSKSDIAFALFGVLVRDTAPSEMDLKKGGKTLSKKLSSSQTCQLAAIYLPCSIAQLPAMVAS